MKLLIFLAVVTIAAAEWTPKPREQLKQDRLDCMKEVKLSQELKEKVSRLEYPDNEIIKDFILCGARKSELWTDTKGWITDRILVLMSGDTSMNEADVRQAIDGCLDDNSQGSPLNEWAYRNFKCVAESNAKQSLAKIMKKIE